MGGSCFYIATRCVRLFSGGEGGAVCTRARRKRWCRVCVAAFLLLCCRGGLFSVSAEERGGERKRGGGGSGPVRLATLAAKNKKIGVSQQVRVCEGGAVGWGAPHHAPGPGAPPGPRKRRCGRVGRARRPRPRHPHAGPSLLARRGEELTAPSEPCLSLLAKPRPAGRTCRPGRPARHGRCLQSLSRARAGSEAGVEPFGRPALVDRCSGAEGSAGPLAGA